MATQQCGQPVIGIVPTGFRAPKLAKSLFRVSSFEQSMPRRTTVSLVWASGAISPIGPHSEVSPMFAP